MYCYSRIRSILRKAGLSEPGSIKFDPSVMPKLTSDLERNVTGALVMFRSLLDKATVRHEPSIVADAVYVLAREFNSMYTSDNHPIVSCEDEERKAARIQLCHAVATAVKEGLDILAIDIVEEM